MNLCTAKSREKGPLGNGRWSRSSPISPSSAIVTDSLVSDIGHITIPVRDMTKALEFYRDLLGFSVEGKVDSIWTVIATSGGRLTLFRQKEFHPIAVGPDGDETPFIFHVRDFGKAAFVLESKGMRVKRETDHSGVVWDPFGNAIGLHDHLESH